MQWRLPRPSLFSGSLQYWGAILVRTTINVSGLVSEFLVPLCVVVCNTGISIDLHLLRWGINILQTERAAVVEGVESVMGVRTWCNWNATVYHDRIRIVTEKGNDTFALCFISYIGFISYMFPFGLTAMVQSSVTVSEFFVLLCRMWSAIYVVEKVHRCCLRSQ